MKKAAKHPDRKAVPVVSEYHPAARHQMSPYSNKLVTLKGIDKFGTCVKFLG